MAATGFGLGRAFKPDLKTVSRLAFYIFSPCLVFTSIMHSELAAAEFGQLALYTLSVIVAMTVLAGGAGWLLKLKRPELAALIVASVFVNGGNYGLALTHFAFGEAALARAVVYYVFSTLSVYSLGVIVASAGKLPTRQALRATLGVPANYALVAAGLLRVFNWQLPTLVDRSVTVLSQAAIPVMLVLLGLQLAEVRQWPHTRLSLIAVASGLQLVVAPLVGVALAAALGLTGVARQAAIIEAAMPTAVITTILAVEYDLDTAIITGTVIASTLLSPLTLTPLIAYLQG